MNVSSVLMDPETLPKLNEVLVEATRGALTDMSAVINHITALEKDLENASEVTLKMKKENEKLKKVRASFTPKTYDILSTAKATVPHGVVKTAIAKDLFKTKDGKSLAALDFEVPYMEWDSAHPEVPQLDENYVFDGSSLVTFLYALNNNHNTWFHGHTGTGKTTFVEQVASRLNWPVIRVNMDNDIERSDFLGQTQLITGEKGTTESRFVEGVLPRAMQSPAILLIDEMDFGKPGIMYVLQRALEAKGLLLTEDGGRLIAPHPMFRMVATANTKGQGDEMGCYPGARIQSNALLDRFTVWLDVKYLTKAQEMSLLKETHPKTDASFREQLAVFAQEIRKAFVGRELLQAISPRALMAICSAREFYLTVLPPKEATQMALDNCYIQKVTDDTLAKVKEIAARCFKE